MVRNAATSLRKALGLSKDDFAEKIGVTGRLICYLEKGERDWSDELLVKIQAL